MRDPVAHTPLPRQAVPLKGVESVTRYLLQRLLMTIVALWAIVTITFFLMHAVPGGPFARDKELPEVIIHNLERRYHLDWPLWKQYLSYLWNVCRWDFGPSFKYTARSVNDIINDSFPVSATLGALAVGLSLVVGIPVGIISAVRQYKWEDNVTRFLATLGVALPNYVVAAALIYFVGVKAGWLPVARWGTWDRAIMPALALAGFPTAFITRLVRSSLLEVLQQDFIRTARAKGLPGQVVMYRHALKNALIPVVTYVGPLIAGIFTGSFVIERMFAIPGLGFAFVASITNRDYTLIMGATVFYSALLLVMNFLVDIAYVVIDPRINLADIKE